MIKVHNLNKTYDKNRSTANRVLKDVCFTLPDTGFVCILGPSGCGKTSLLNALGGLDAFDNGTLATDDVSVSRYGTSAYEQARNRSFGYIFQNYYLLENHSVAYNVYLGLHSLDLTHKEKMQRVRMALQAVDMERYIRRTVGQLSGGQQQRVAIARALVRRPKVIFADEPTGNLDEANTRNICALLRKASKESLVIMVTHEERIARFYADRIITLDQGNIRSDTDSWDRESLSASSDKILYAGDYEEENTDSQRISLRFLQQEGAPQVKLTVVAMNDRVVIKLDDSRPVTLSASDSTVSIEEGTRPVLTLESVDANSAESIDLFHEPPAPQCRAGKGVTGRMMFREAHSLMGGKGIQRAGLRVFLALLTVLALLVTGDYIAISQLDPEDFITADSHILEISMGRGNNIDSSEIITGKYGQYWQTIQSLAEASGAQITILPEVPTPIETTVSLYYQMDDETLTFPACSKVYLDHLDKDTLIYGRMPKTSEEIVVDRQVLEAILGQENTVANSVNRIDFFLEMPLNFGRRKIYTPTIVGICDSGERSIYMSREAMLAVSSRGTSLVTLSELKERDPQRYGQLELGEDECIVFTNNVGEIYKHRIGQKYNTGVDIYLTIVDAVSDLNVAASAVVHDSLLDQIILSNLEREITLYCANKSQSLDILRSLLTPKPLEEISATAAQYAQQNPDLDDCEVLRACLANHLYESDQKRDLIQVQYLIQSKLLSLDISDPYGETYRAYEEAASIRADGRTIVVVTLLALSMVMLYLLCRSQVQGRLSLLAVYRLLGIPKRKLYGIFAMESVFSALRTVLPAGILTYGAVSLMAKVPEIKLTLELPWLPATIVGLLILGYYLVVSLLPLYGPLKLPPARLAAKYDL